MSNSVLLDKSKALALDVIKLCEENFDCINKYGKEQDRRIMLVINDMTNRKKDLSLKNNAFRG